MPCGIGFFAALFSRARFSAVCYTATSTRSRLLHANLPNLDMEKIMSRRYVIAGNWKMNQTPAQTKEFITALAPMVKGKDGCDIVLCVPFVDILAATEAAKGTNIRIGAQNVHFAEKGAFTGEISAEMLKAVGTEYVIIGHSERRQYFGETDETVNKRVKAALAAGLKVILCVGEMLDARQAGKLALAGIDADELKRVIIAYEPVWAIGTGLTATPEQADETCGVIRETIAKLYGTIAAKEILIQYGGSMNDQNAAALLAKENIDGGLIGGASLKTDAFTAIVSAANA